MDKIQHQLTHTEIAYGYIKLTKMDGMQRFFSKSSGSFDLIAKGVKLYGRSVGESKIWMGKEIMRKFSPNDVVTIIKKGNKVFVD